MMIAGILTVTSVLALCGLGSQPVGQPGIRDAADVLQSRIEALRPATVAWRKIQWKSCLLEGLKESREQKKPVLLWIFIDRPVDDARC